LPLTVASRAATVTRTAATSAMVVAAALFALKFKALLAKTDRDLVDPRSAQIWVVLCPSSSEVVYPRTLTRRICGYRRRVRRARL